MRQWILFSVILLLAAPAWGKAWKECDATHDGGASKTSVQVNSSVCFDITAAEGTGDDSPILAVGHCENFDILYDGDVASSVFTSDNTVNVYSCVMPTASANNCFILESATLTGDPSTNLEAIYGAAGLWVYVDLLVDGGTASRLVLKCNGPGR